MKVKELDRTVNVAWSPAAQHPIMLAAGTAAQQLDSSFSTNAALEIYSLNLTEPGPDMELRSVTPSDHRFHKVAWGSYGFGGEHDNGIIVGGCDGGRIQMYSAAKLLAGEDGVISQQEKHTGAVRALDFNPFQANLLATGASDSEIYIWDLNNTASPMTPGAKSQPSEDVLWISWNRQVQHILASTFSQRCVVWDLRKNEPIIKLSDSTSRIRWKVVAWHPEVATQLCLASEDDQTPVIQLWDLRFATSPLKVLENHQRGILSIAWCAQDPDLLLSAGKDDRILCWNPNSDMPGGEVVCDVATSNQWNFDVSWCPRNPAIIASSSFDGHVSIYSLMGGQAQVQTSNKIADSFPGMDAYAQAPASQQHQVFVDLRKPPKWLRRPAGAAFGFGGKLVSFGNDFATSGSRSVNISQVVTEHDLVARSDQLEAALQCGQFVDYCHTKMVASRSQHDKFMWSVLRANFMPDPRTEMLGLLGYKEDELNNKLSRFVGKPANARSDVDKLSDGIASLHGDSQSGDEGGDGEEDDINTAAMDGNGDAISAFDTIAATTKATPEKKPFKIKTGDDVDGLICQSLLLGNTEAAVELCLQDGRMADAIILAMTGGSDLLAKTQYRYFQQSQGYLSSLISAVVTEDWSQVVRSCEVDSWKEALAAALTHTTSEELPLLCDQLGQRLESEGHGAMTLNAQLCYICAGNLNKLVDSWTTAVKPTTPAQLQELVELVMVLRKAVEQQGRSVETSGKLADLLSRYASLLASQGSLNAALAYLGNSEEEQISLLRDRLYRTLGHLPAYPQQQQQQQSKAQPRAQAQRQTKNFYQTEQQRQPPQPAMNQGYTAAPVTTDLHTGYSRGFQQPYNPLQTSQQQTIAAPYPASSPQPHGSYKHQRFYGKSWEQSSRSASPSHWSGTNVTSRGKYVVDPSVKNPQTRGGPAHNPYAPAPLSNQPPANLYSPAPLSSQPAAGQYAPGLMSSQPQPSLYTPAPVPTLNAAYGASQQGVYNPGNTFTPQEPAYNTADPSHNPGMPQPAGPLSNAPPGWNDPPMVKNAARNQPQCAPAGDKVEMSAKHAGTRKWQSMIAHAHDQPKADYVPQNPITHPLYAGVAPEQQGMGISNSMMQMGSSGPAPPTGYNGSPHPGQVYEAAPTQYNTTGYNGDSGYAPGVVQQHHQQQAVAPPVKMAEVAKPKGPIPEEHMYLQTVFDELQARCSCAANNPQSRRKLEDVLRKLEALYDALRDSKLSGNTLQGLHQMVQLVQIGDYTRGLELHTQLVSGPDFSQIANFMPGLKVLLQSALQLGVYLQ